MLSVCLPTNWRNREETKVLRKKVSNFFLFFRIMCLFVLMGLSKECEIPIIIIIVVVVIIITLLCSFLMNIVSFEIQYVWF